MQPLKQSLLLAYMSIQSGEELFKQEITEIFPH